MNAIIECTHVQRSFVRGIPVLNGLDLTMAEGSIVGLVAQALYLVVQVVYVRTSQF